MSSSSGRAAKLGARLRAAELYIRALEAMLEAVTAGDAALVQELRGFLRSEGMQAKADAAISCRNAGVSAFNDALSEALFRQKDWTAQDKPRRAAGRPRRILETNHLALLELARRYGREAPRKLAEAHRAAMAPARMTGDDFQRLKRNVANRISQARRWYEDTIGELPPAYARPKNISVESVSPISVRPSSTSSVTSPTTA